jgi:Mg-chelatase subunit ChlD
MDVIFVLDISSSVMDKYQLSINFATAVTYGLDVDSNAVRVGAIAFSTSVLGQFYLDDHPGDREAVVSSLRFFNPGGSTDASMALKAILTDQLGAGHGARPNVPTFIIFISDGYFIINVNQTFALADQIKSSYPQLSIYSIAIGSYPQTTFLSRVSSDPDSDFMLMLPGLSDVASTSDLLLSRLCKGSNGIS